MNPVTKHRLDGFEPDNLLAFMALLGLLRIFEESQPDWYARVAWTADEPPLRPILQVPVGVDQDSILCAAALGLNALAERHRFDGLTDLKLSPEDARKRMNEVAKSSDGDRYSADMWASLVSDSAVKDKKEEVERTPLCLLGVARTNFLKTFKEVPNCSKPPKRGRGKKKEEISETDCLREALFEPWKRPDKMGAFRWDPNEDARHALRWTAPADDKETTQHGANRLAAIGLSVLTVVPIPRRGQVELAILGGQLESSGKFNMCWPIWREPISLASIRALLSHPGLDHQKTRTALGIIEVRQAWRISVGRYYMNFTSAEPKPNS